jgi:exodeoxyribonuclease VIII
MIDIETLGNGPTSVILSIGVVAFDPDSNAIGENFHQLINIDSCLRAGLTVDGSTIQWWMTQPDAARELFNKLDEHGLSLHHALAELRDWMNNISKAPIFWCNHPSFDAAILENAYRRCDMKSPWQYYNVKDYSTIRGSIPKALFDKIRVRPEVAHDAMHDALAQAKSVQRIYATRWVGQPELA